MKKILTSILFHILFLQIVKSQTATIFGVVTEGGTNQPIEFVTVYIKETNKNVQTNAAGEYSLSIPVGKPFTKCKRKCGMCCGFVVNAVHG